MDIKRDICSWCGGLGILNLSTPEQRTCGFCKGSGAARFFSVKHDQENLHPTEEEALETAYGEGWDPTEFPVWVVEFKRLDPSKAIQRLVDRSVEDILDDLDSDFGDPEGRGVPEPTLAVKEAAAALVKALNADYVPWACEPTGREFPWTEEQFREVVGPA